jgi:signal transduction histidine kinase
MDLDADWNTAVKVFAMRLIGRRAPYMVLALSLVVTVGTAAYTARVARQPDGSVPVVLLLGLAVSSILFGITYAGLRAQAMDVTELNRAQEALAKHAERLRILHEIDRALIAEEAPEAIAAAAIRPLRELLAVPRAIVNMFDLAAGEVEWLAAAGRRRVHLGPGVRYSMRLMGDVEALRRGERQLIDVHALPPGPEVDALLASGVHVYMVVPMIAGGELIGALSFGGAPGPFPAEQVSIAQEAAMQLAIAIAQARLHERVKRQAEELDLRVRERTQELHTAHAELQQSNAELRQLAAELQATNKELAAFSYSVSHDLRAPIRHIDGFSHRLAEDYGDRLDDEGRRLLSVVRSSAALMGRLIDDLLALARLGRVALARTEIDMTALARHIITELTQATHASPCLVDLRPLPPAQGDIALVRQVWRNLIDNAIKYSSKRAQPRVEISGRVEDRYAVYCVKDNGAGFDMRYYDKLFSVFQRLHTDNELSGTGVGLAIVYRVVTRHGGKVWAESQLDEGASFYFSLPLAGEARATGDPDHAPSPTGRGPG